MKTLEQIKNDYAVSKGFENWKDLVKNTFDWFVIENVDIHISEVMKTYAIECLKIASDNAEVNVLDYNDYEVNKSTITNENNIIK